MNAVRLPYMDSLRGSLRSSYTDRLAGSARAEAVGGFKYHPHIRKHADDEKSLREHGRGPLPRIHRQVRRRGRDQIRCGPRLCERLARRRIGQTRLSRTQPAKNQQGGSSGSSPWPAISPSLTESDGCGLFGGESAIDRPVKSGTNGTTVANSDEWICSDCGERATPDLVTPEESIVVVVRCPVCGLRDEVPQGVVWG